MINIKKPFRIKDASENQNKTNFDNLMDIEENSVSNNNNIKFENYNFNDLKQSSNFYITENSGDIGSNTKGYLINREKYKKYFKIQKINTKWEN